MKRNRCSSPVNVSELLTRSTLAYFCEPKPTQNRGNHRQRAFTATRVRECEIRRLRLPRTAAEWRRPQGQATENTVASVRGHPIDSRRWHSGASPLNRKSLGNK